MQLDQRRRRGLTQDSAVGVTVFSSSRQAGSVYLSKRILPAGMGRIRQSGVVTSHQPATATNRVAIAMDVDAQAALLGDLNRLDRLYEMFGSAVVAPPAAGSAAATEEPDKLGHLAHHLAASGLTAAMDHLEAWRLLLQGGLKPTYAPMSLLRTAHESVWFAYWLAEPGLTHDQRLARGVAAYFDDLEERRKTETAMARTNVNGPGKLAVDRIDDLMRLAQQRGLTKLNKRGDPVLTVSIPSAVELFDLYEPVSPQAKGQFVYRLESGYAHAKQWALIQGAQRARLPDAHGNSLALITGSDTILAAATNRAVNACEKAVVAYLALRR